jgi:hypothetical protein
MTSKLGLPVCFGRLGLCCSLHHLPCFSSCLSEIVPQLGGVSLQRGNSPSDIVIPDRVRQPVPVGHHCMINFSRLRIANKGSTGNTTTYLRHSPNRRGRDCSTGSCSAPKNWSSRKRHLCRCPGALHPLEASSSGQTDDGRLPVRPPPMWRTADAWSPPRGKAAHGVRPVIRGHVNPARDHSS